MSLSVSKKRISGRGNVRAAPRPKNSSLRSDFSTRPQGAGGCRTDEADRSIACTIASSTPSGFLNTSTFQNRRTRSGIAKVCRSCVALRSSGCSCSSQQDGLRRIITHPPLEGGSKLSLSRLFRTRFHSRRSASVWFARRRLAMRSGIAKVCRSCVALRSSGCSCSSQQDGLRRIITHPPLEGGSKLSLSVSKKRISGRGNVRAAPRPEKFFASLRFFDPPSRGIIYLSKQK